MQNLMIIWILILGLFTGCSKEDGFPTNYYNLVDQVNAYPKETMNEAEIASLMWMREEEKLARDVYISLYQKWGINVFTNISASEQTHMDAVLALLQRYNLTDPAQDNTVGVFKDANLQALYNPLMVEGNKSLLDAFKVDATIEDLDIFDLDNWLTKVDNQDLIFVYQSLMKGSRNHMRSFYSQILSVGGTYTAQYISQADLEVIVNGAKETGPW